MQLVLLLAVVETCMSSSFRHKKSRKSHSKQVVNNDDRKLVSILEKISMGKKDKDTMMT